jgi:hypothetical protein
MKNEQALQVLKEVLDAATKSGVFPIWTHHSLLQMLSTLLQMQ